MKISKILVICAVMVVAILSCKKENNTVVNVLNDADNNFIKLASLSNYAEIETAKVALSKTTDSSVLSFAQLMFADHTKAQSDLKTMGTIVGFTITDTIIDAAHAAFIAQLDTLTGRPFDSTYIQNQLTDHQATINFYTDEVKNGSQINVRAYANSNLQILQYHYELADTIAVNMH